MSEFKIDCIVLYANPYDFVNEKTGEKMSGISMQYIMDNKLTPTQDKETKGQRIAKASLPKEFMSKITEAPAVYEVTMSFQANSAGQPVMKPMDLKFKQSFNK